MKRLYMVILLAGICLVSAVASGFSIFYNVFYVLVAALLGNLGWAYLNLQGLQITALRRSGRAKVSDFAESDLTIKNFSPLPKLLIEVQDMAELPGQVTGKVFNLRPGRTLEWKARPPLKKRGSYPLGPARAFSTDFFGLYRLQRTFPGVEQIIVYPAVRDLPMFHLPQADWTHQGAARRRSQVVAPTASSVREYSYGDSLKRIHWPSTARIGKLMVKDFDTDVGNQVWIILDLQQDVQAGGEVENTEEYGVTAAASIVARCRELGWPVGLIAQGDREYFVAADRSAATEERMMDMFAVARAEGRSPLDQVLMQAGDSITPPATLVVITPSTDIGWIRILRSFLGKQFRVAVVMIDADSFGMIGSARKAVGTLEEIGILTYLVQQGDDLATALSYDSAVPKASVQATA